MTLTELILTYPGYVDAGNPTDAAVLAWLNQPDTFQQDISYQDLMLWVAGQNIAAKLHAAIAAGQGALTEDQWNGILTMDMLLRSGGSIAMSKTDLRGLINNITGPGVPLKPADRQALFAFSDYRAPRWNWANLENGGEVDASGVNLGDVIQARAV